MKINPRLKEWVAQDNRNQDIAGTNKYQKTRPKTGRWRQITTQACCAAFQLTYTPSDVTASSFAVNILCDGDAFVTLVVTPDTAPTADINAVVKALKAKAGYLGKWSTDGTVIELQLSSAVALNCPDATDLTFTVEPSA